MKQRSRIATIAAFLLLLASLEAPLSHFHPDHPEHDHDHHQLFHHSAPEQGPALSSRHHDEDAQLHEWLNGQKPSPDEILADLTASPVDRVASPPTVAIHSVEPHSHDPPDPLAQPQRGPPPSC